MRGGIAALAKLSAIAFVAAVTSWMAVLVLLSFEAPGFPIDSRSLASDVFPIALLGNFAVGFPVASLVYFLAAKQLARAPSTLFVLAALAGIMMILTCFVLGDGSLVLWFGVPSLIASLTFAAFGYLWMIKPMREALYG